MNKFLSLAWLAILVIGMYLTPAPSATPETPPMPNESPSPASINEAVSHYQKEKLHIVDPGSLPTTPETQKSYVWASRTGKRYHSNEYCSNMKSPRQITLEEAGAEGLSPCQNCY